MLPDRIWIHPDDPLQCYITKAIDGAAPYTRESEPCVYKEGGPVGYFLGPIMFWTSGCGHDIGEDRPHWTYCPFCGGRIVIEESKG